MSRDNQRGGNASLPQEEEASSKAVVIRLYRDLLGRAPTEEQLVEAMERMAAGTSAVDLAIDLATGAEARYALIRSESASSGDAAATLPLGIEDVLRVITDRLTTGGETPLPVEAVLNIFDDVRGGLELSRALETAAPIMPQASATAPAAARQMLPLDQVAEIIRIQYRGIFGRRGAPAEIAGWVNNYENGQSLADMILFFAHSAEAIAVSKRLRPDGVPPGLLVQIAFEVILERGATGVEVDLYRSGLENDTIDFNDLVLSFFADTLARKASNTEFTAPFTAQEAFLFGAGGVISSDRWEKRREDPEAAYSRSAKPSTFYKVVERDDPAVSIITSLYRGRKYLRHFLDNMVSQTIFNDCELLIIDADSPEGEEELIRQYQEEFNNIKYVRTPDRIGIYEAWNIAAKMARGRYLTNANLDDCRRNDSFEIQAGILDTLSFVDVTYQEVLYSFRENLSFDEIERYGLSTKLPVLTSYNMVEFNSPHNGPMWRRSLHDELGYFNENYKSASDFEFWVRCRLAGKTFFKSNEPHVAYYVNPQGLSTRADTRGVVEGQAIAKQFFRRLVSPELTLARDDFIAMTAAIQPFRTAATVRYDIVQDALLALGAGRGDRTATGAAS